MSSLNAPYTSGDSGATFLSEINADLAALNTDKAEKTGQEFSGKIFFSGTDHAGIQVISLTTAERNALTPVNGDLIYNETDDKFQMYQGGSWVDVTSVAADADTTTKGIVEKATEAEIEAGTSTGGTGAELFVGADSTHLPDDNEMAALAGSSGTPSGSNKFVTADDVSDAAASGKIVRATGTALPAIDGSNVTDIEIKTSDMDAGETITGATLPTPVYIDDTDNEVKICDANVVATLDFIGFAITNSTDGNAITVQSDGIVAGFTGLDIGKKYYVQDTAGTIGTSVGTSEVLVGIAISATQILIQFGADQFISSSLNNEVSDSVAIPANANKVIANVTTEETSSGGPNGKGQLVIYNKGLTVATFSEIGNVSNQKDIILTWNSGTGQIDITGDAGTGDDIDLYFYKK